jgi:hypothetical protein
VLIKPSMVNSMLDLQVQWARRIGLPLQGPHKPLALDSSMFESRHVSRHYDKRRRQEQKKDKKDPKRGKNGRKKAGDRRRSRVVKALPKLSLAVSSSCHLILAAKATTGAGADQPFFEPLLFDAWRRSNVRVAVADAGYDSEANHCIARHDMRVRSIIPPNSGRPTEKLPSGRHRRNMHHRFKRGADKTLYGQRWQSETVNSMIKRNLDSALRARTARRRSYELLLRVLTHNLMILTNSEG